MNFIEQLDALIEGVESFSNWVKPSTAVLKREYNVEYSLKGLGAMLGDVWPTADDFVKAVARGKVTRLSKADDAKIQYRSRTRNKEQLIRLLKTYRSWPEFRNDDTVNALYDGFSNNSPMEMPIVLRFPDGKMRVFAGNTRLDVAFQVGAPVKVIIVDV